jgi:hypothetical protein
VTLPALSSIRQFDTHRLIPSKYLPDGDSVLAGIADDKAHLDVIFDLDHATNDRLVAENNLLPGIGIHELVFAVPNFRIINAAFTHAHPQGSRFNGPDRGAWYAGFELETAQREVAWHKAVEYAEIDYWHDSITYDDFLADFDGAFHDIRGSAAYEACLAPDSYVAAQGLAAELLNAGSLGLVYPSVRHEGGTCIACFRPAIVGNVRRDVRYRFTWEGDRVPKIDVA